MVFSEANPKSMGGGALTAVASIPFISYSKIPKVLLDQKCFEANQRKEKKRYYL
jgi:hypothetical protein